MKSKWLDWTPGAEIMEKIARPKPSKPTEPGFVGFDGSTPADFAITRDPSNAARQVDVIPDGVLLIAPRYDGGSKPLAAIPKCWCCGHPWRLDRLQESKGRTYAFLEPDCSCWAVHMCCACFMCCEHCQCPARARENGNDT
jgi:hypothetical protein